MTEMSEDDSFDRAVAALGYRGTFVKDGLSVPVAILVRTGDWLPLRAPWWRGKEVSIIGADTSGNFFLRHADGSIRYWRHSEGREIVVAASVREFAQHFTE